MSLKKIAQELGLLGRGPGGREPSKKDLESKVLERLKELQQTKKLPSATRFFDKSVFADCQIRVTIAAEDDSFDGRCEEGRLGDGTNEKPSAAVKRRAVTIRSNSAKRAKVTGAVRVIKAHAIILAQRIPYFETMLNGVWRERDGAIEIKLPSVEDFEDFRLLLKLSYGSTFVLNDGERVPRDVLLRLLVLSNYLGMMDALTELTGALKEGMTYEEAVEVFRVLPEEIYGYDAIRSLLSHAGDTIAKGLGPVHELWGTGPCIHAGESCALSIRFPLAAKAKALPLIALEKVLRSSKLQVRSENEAFTLMESWLLAQNNETKEEQDAWDRLSKSMRFRRMSCNFLSYALARSPWLVNSRRVRRIFRNCVWQMEIPPHDWIDVDALSLPDRGGRNPRQWTLRSHFLQAELTQLEEGSPMRRDIGVANGYGVTFGVERIGAGGSFFYLINAVNPLLRDSCESEEDECGAPSGEMMEVAVRVQDLRSVELWEVKEFDNRYILMNIPSWEAFIAEGSPYFRSGKCRFKVTFTFWKGVPKEEKDFDDSYQSDGEL